jgi:hypothetical protein
MVVMKMDMEKRENTKRMIKEKGLVCDCGEKVYPAGAGPIENRPNYNRYFEYLECPKCRKEYDLQPAGLREVEKGR